MSKLTVQIVETTTALDHLSVVWGEANIWLSIHDLQHTVIHTISGFQTALERADHSGDWFTYIVANTASGREVGFYGTFDHDCQTCRSLAGMTTDDAGVLEVVDEVS